jgi:hypothetical protein
METKLVTDSTGSSSSESGFRSRRRRNASDPPLRYFLLAQGSSPAKPELGQELASEGEALIEAFRSGQPFYTLAAWKPVPEVNGGNPVIVKQPLSPKLT